ncbi:MAG: tetratricopeptide repeat protein [Symploca sp. SIO2E6]|nr:tetratricopeptide repeat protein [Symploca sp. SIO2E6]
MIPLLGSVFRGDQPTTEASPAATPTISAQEQEKLEAEAIGYESVVQREPNNTTALRGLVESRLRLGDIKGVISPLEQLSKLSPEQTDYVILLAQAKQQVGDREGAAQAYRDVLALEQGNMNALQGLVSLLVQQGRPEAAIGELQKKLKTAASINEFQPGTIDTVGVQMLLGQVYASQQRYTEALTVYDEAIKSNQQAWRPVLAKALILKQQGKTAQAEPLFTKAIDLAPAQHKDQIKQLASSSESAEPNNSPNGETTEVPAPIPTVSDE